MGDSEFHVDTPFCPTGFSVWVYGFHVSADVLGLRISDSRIGSSHWKGQELT